MRAYSKGPGWKMVVDESVHNNADREDARGSRPTWRSYLKRCHRRVNLLNDARSNHRQEYIDDTSRVMKGSES